MSTPVVAVVRVNPKQAFSKIEQAIVDHESEILSTLAAGLDRKRFLAVALQAITRTPKLLECTPTSFVLALRDAAELGLEPSGLFGSAYLVPYRNKKTTKLEAKLIAGYRGLIDLARRSGEVRTVEAHVVRERDVFEYEYGTEQHLRHRPYLNRLSERDDEQHLLDAGPYVAAYSLARLASGTTQFDVMDVAEIEAVRRSSKAADDGPWVTHWAQMACKTPTRRLLKYLPLSVVQLTRALELEDEAENEAQPSATSATARRALTDALNVSTSAQDASGETIDAETQTDTADEQIDEHESSETLSDDEIEALTS